MKATKFFKPYKNKKYNLQTTGKGVYIIKKNNIPYYVGLSFSDVKKTMYRHFQRWNDPRLERVTYVRENKNLFKVKVIFCKTDKETSLLEYLLIKKLKPKDNTAKNELYSNVDINKTAEKLKTADKWIETSEETPF